MFFMPFYVTSYNHFPIYISSLNGFKLLNPLPDDKLLDWSKLKQTADDILKHI